MGQCGANFHHPSRPVIGIEFGPHYTYNKIAEYIASGLQNEPTDRSNTELYRLLTGESNSYQQYLISNHKSSGIFWSLGLILVLTSILLFIITAFWQCCSSCRPKNSKKTNKSRMFLILFLTFALFFLLVGFFEFNHNQTKTTDAFEKLYVNEELIAEDTKQFLLSGLKETKCKIESFFDNISDQLNVEIPLMINKVKKESGFQALLELNQYNVYNQLPAQPDGLNSQCIAVYAGISNSIGKIETKFKDLSSTLDTANNRLTSYQNDIQKAIGEELKKRKNEILQKLEMEDEISRKIDLFKTMSGKHLKKMANHPDYKSAQTLIDMIYNIPVITTVIFATFTIISLMLSSKSHDKCSSALIMFGFYMTSAFAVVILLMFCISFIGGWAVSTTCATNFYNLDHTLLNNVEREIEVPTGRKIVINAGNILKTCMDPSKTIFSSVDIKPLVPTNFINPTMFANAASQFQQLGNQINLKEIEEAMKKAEEEENSSKQLISLCEIELSQQIAYMKSTKYQMKQVVELAKNVNVNDVSAIASSHFKPMMESKIEKFITHLKTNVFKCHPIITIYGNLGAVVCDGLGRPVHGLWASVGLSGLSIFLLSILFLLSYRWLNKSRQSQVTLDGIQ